MSKLLNVQKYARAVPNLPGVPVTQTIWSFFAALRVKAFLGSIYPSPVDTSEMVDPPSCLRKNWNSEIIRSSSYPMH